MVILVRYEDLKELLEADLEAWMNVGGGPNFNAFEFDPNLADMSQLDALGYYSNRDAWIAGVQVKKIQAYLNQQLSDPVKAAQNK